MYIFGAPNGKPQPTGTPIWRKALKSDDMCETIYSLKNKLARISSHPYFFNFSFFRKVKWTENSSVQAHEQSCATLGPMVRRFFARFQLHGHHERSSTTSSGSVRIVITRRDIDICGRQNGKGVSPQMMQTFWGISSNSLFIDFFFVSVGLKWMVGI